MESEYSWNHFFKDYWFLLKGRRLLFGYYTVVRSISTLLSFVAAYFLGKIIDFFTNYSIGQSLTPFVVSAVVIGVLGFLEVWLRFYSKIHMQNIAAEIRKEARISAMNKIMTMDLKWHESEDTGSKIQKIYQGGESLYQGIRVFSNDGLGIIVNLFGAIIIFLFLDIKYLAFSLIYLILYLFAEYQFNKKISYWQDQMNKLKEKVSGKIHESASNILAVKSLGLKDRVNKSTISDEEEYYDTWKKQRDVSKFKNIVVKGSAAIAYALFILLVGFDVLSGAITVGAIYVFVNYFGKLRGALDEVTNQMTEFISVKSAVGRFMTILGLETYEKDSSMPNFPKNWQKIEFKDVTFKYKDKYVLKNFNLTINRNDKMGIVGRSGSGKSTIVKLLLRLYSPQKGQILVDGHDISEFNSQSITNVISIVLQESEMFNLSLVDNITISSEFKADAFKEAARISQLLPIIPKLPDGINTLIGEKGYKLSGGERQRIGISRAVYKNSQIMLLDEATSSLDSKTEELIQKEIEKLTDKTLILIAHRLSTLKNVDKIYFVENGSITESGSFKQLMVKKDKFYQLYRIQKKTR